MRRDKEVKKKRKYKKKRKIRSRPSTVNVIKKEFKKDKWALFSLFYIVIIFIVIFTSATFLIDEEQLMRIRLQDRFKEPSFQSIFGKDQGGKDVLGQLIVGAKNSLIIAFSITFLTTSFGIVVGLICGYYGGWIDNMIMRIIDFFGTIPSLMFIIVFVTLVPKYTVTSFVCIMSLFLWTGTARLIRSKVLSESKKNYVIASKSYGTNDFTIMFRHILPNLSSIIIVEMTLNLAGNVGIETGLSYLGFGLPQSTPSLGTLVSYANNPIILQQYWWVWLPSCLFILFMMLAINYVGQALRRSTDARQRLG